VPLIDIKKLVDADIFFAKPKSHIFIVSLCSKIFWGFRSRWSILFWWR